MEPRDSVQSYDALFESTTIRVWQVDLECRITRISRAVFSDVDLLPEDFVGKPMYRFAPPDVRARLIAENTEIMRSGTPRLGVVEQYTRPDSTDGWFCVDRIPCRNENGEVTGLLILAAEISRYKGAEDALFLNRLHLSEAMDLARMVYWVFDDATGEFVFNDPFYALYATTAEREGGYRMSAPEYGRRFFHPDDLPRYTELTGGGQRPGEEFLANMEHRIIRRDGQVRHIISRMRGFIDNTGCPRLYGLNQDITERKLAEVALRQSEERYRSLFDDSPVALIEVDASAARARLGELRASGIGDPEKLARENPELIRELHSLMKFVNINRAGLDLYEVEDLDNLRRLARDFAANAPDEFFTGNSLFLQTEKEAQKEGVRLTGKGNTIHVLSRWTTAPGYNESLGRVLICDVDLTERKRAEEALHTATLLLSDAMDLADIVCFEFDPSTNEFIFNDPLYTYLGTTAVREGGYRMAIGKYIRSFVHPDDTEAFIQAVEAIRQKKDREYVVDVEHRIVRADGETRHILVRIRGTRDASGRATRVYGTAQDITKHRQAEEENFRLQSQFLQAQKMEAIGTLAGGIAHDFNNILTVMMGFGNLAQLKIAEGDPVRPFIDQIVQSAGRAAELTRSLLAFSRKQNITLAPRDISDVVKNGARLLKRLLHEDIELKLHLADKPTIAAVDATQMDQVLMNLSANARDAMPHGGVLTLSTGVVTLDESFKKIHGFGRPGAYVLLSVSDTGVGMEEKTIARIFEPFFTTKEVGKGTGLGLASVYGIVKQHGGYITVKSELFRGTIFDIYLPVVTMEEQPPMETQEIRGGHETVLVIEDDRNVRNLISMLLSNQGYTVLEAASGHEGIKVFNEHRNKGISLVTIDVVMPGMNGKQVFDEINLVDPAVRVIFMSGYTGDIVIDKGIQKEGVDFLQKPITAANLLAKVREVLDR
jgi:PAS domain S-box-containing protein